MRALASAERGSLFAAAPYLKALQRCARLNMVCLVHIARVSLSCHWCKFLGSMQRCETVQHVLLAWYSNFDTCGDVGRGMHVDSAALQRAAAAAARAAPAPSFAARPVWGGCSAQAAQESPQAARQVLKTPL
jgi:hypothetical protein